MRLSDPIALKQIYWPHIYLYNKQVEILLSVWYNRDTIVPAANMVGKDFVAAMIVLLFFISRDPCKIITTSAGEQHLDVLWGEMNRHINVAATPLKQSDGGPLVIKDLEIRKILNGEEQPDSYIKGMVAADANLDKMAGHHATSMRPEDINDGVPRNLFVVDEASSAKRTYFDKASGWARRKLIFGQPWDCENEFKWAIEGNPATRQPGGDLPRSDGTFDRKIIEINAEDSPNVRYARSQIARGMEPDNRIVVPGLLPWDEYCFRRKTFDPVRQRVMLDAKFYKGAQNLLYPPLWLNKAEEIARALPSKRRGKAMGVDSAEGGDNTAWTIIDEFGVVDQVSMRTPDTTVVTSRTLALMREHQMPPNRVCFDRGGGGKPHADRLALMGYPVQTVHFGDPATVIEPRRGIETFDSKTNRAGLRKVYKNRRAEMYGMLRGLIELDLEQRPVTNGGFGIPGGFVELRRQMAPIPLSYDDEGTMYVLPKRKRPGTKEDCLMDLLGCSPDELDSLVLAVFALHHKVHVPKAGAI